MNVDNRPSPVAMPAEPEAPSRAPVSYGAPTPPATSGAAATVSFGAPTPPATDRLRSEPAHETLQANGGQADVGGPVPPPEVYGAPAEILANNTWDKPVEVRQVGLGLGIEHDQKGEVVIAEIIPGYGAFAAGRALQPWDILRAVDGRSVLKQPIKTIHGYTIGDEGSVCVLRISRAGRVYDVEITRLGLVSEDDGYDRSFTRHIIAPKSNVSFQKKVSLGFGVEENERGDLVIQELVPGFGAYQSKQIRSGDILLGVDGMNVRDMSLQAIADRTLGAEGEPCTLSLMRGLEEFDVECIRVSPVIQTGSNGFGDAEEGGGGGGAKPTPEQQYGLAAPTFSDPAHNY